MEESTHVLAELGPVTITWSSTITGPVITMWVIIALLGVLSILATRRLRDVPGVLQTGAELVVGRLREYYAENLGREHAEKYFPVLATFYILIIVSNYCGVLPGAGHLKGFAVPTASLSVTAGLGVIAFFTTHVVGIRERGLGHYLASFAKPLILVILMLPLNILEQFIRPMSLALRLFGNMYGEEEVLTKLYEIFPIGLPLIMNVLSLLFCMLQAKVFTMLLSIYISEAAEAE